MSVKTPLLDGIKTPADVRRLDKSELKTLADELRAETIDTVSVTGGHLGAGLGVIELTVALHYVFDTPRDRLIWDVGHQAYPHKILTGRRERVHGRRYAPASSPLHRREHRQKLCHLLQARRDCERQELHARASRDRLGRRAGERRRSDPRDEAPQVP